MSWHLHLNRKQAFGYFQRMMDNLRICDGRAINVVFNNAWNVGLASIDNFTGPISEMRLGVKGLSGKYDFVFAPVDDLQFTKTVVALYHEYGHYLQNYGPNKNIQTAISEASVVGNKPYYYKNRNELPHEISAEMTGVAMAWDAMSTMFSKENADTCMLEYINYRSSETSYMLPLKQGGYKDRSEIETAFVSAMERSLNEPRTPSGDFLRDTRNEYVRLLIQGERVYTASPNAYHAGKLIGTMPGGQRDRMLASLSIHLHPDVLDDHPELKSENLMVEHVFGKPLAVDKLPDAANPKTDKHSGALEMLQSMMSRGYEDDNVDDPELGE